MGLIKNKSLNKTVLFIWLSLYYGVFSFCFFLLLVTSLLILYLQVALIYQAIPCTIFL